VVFGFKVRGSHDPKGDNLIPAATTVVSGTEAEINSVIQVVKRKEQEQEQEREQEKGIRALPSCRISVACLKPAESEEQLLQFWS
jgi:hypothetical protein